MNTAGIAAANQARAEKPEGDNPAPGDPRIVPMRERFGALGYTQFYPSDRGYTAAHPARGAVHYRTWADVEADIARKEALAARVCERCTGPITIGSMRTPVGVLCADCAHTYLQEVATAQADQTAATRQACLIARTHLDLAAKSESAAIVAQHVRDARAAILDMRGAEVSALQIDISRQMQRVAALQNEALAALPDALRVASGVLIARGWQVRMHGAEYRLQAPTGDTYATDADGVEALAQLVVERPDATPDELAALVSAIDDTPAKQAEVPAWAAPLFVGAQQRFAALGWRLEYSGDDRFVMYPPGGDRPGIGNATWHGVLSRLETIEHIAQQNAVNAAAIAESRTADIPPDIAQAAAALALVVAPYDGDRLLLHWPDESEDDLISQSPEQALAWLRDEAPQLAMARAELLGWKAGTHKRAGQTMHAYHRAADGRETAEYADQALAAGEALRIAQADPAATCAHCGKPSAGKRNIGGMLIERCAGCAAREEEHDLREQLGAQYKTCVVNLDGAWHFIKWDGTGASGNYTYDEALAMYHSSAMTLRRFAAGTPTPREAAAAWLGQMSATLQRANEHSMFRYSEMQTAAQHVAALLAATPLNSGRLLEENERGPLPTLADLDDPLAAIERDVTDVETLIADGQILPAQARSLADCRKRLDDLAGDETIPTERYEALYTRIGDDERRLAELAEAGVEVAG